MQSVLVLNATYQPLSVVSAFRAVKLLLDGTVIPLDLSETYYRSATATIQIPYVVIRKNMVKVRPSGREPAFSKRGVLVRDNYTCGYCGSLATTIDHIVPTSKGGKSTYANCVASCKACNWKKGDKSLEQMGWSLDKNKLTPVSKAHSLLSRFPLKSEARQIVTPYIMSFQHQL